MAASGAVAIVVAILLIFRDTLLAEVFQKDVIGDKAREVQGEPALKVVGVERTKLGDEHDIFVRTDDYQLNKQDETIIQDIFDQRTEPILARARQDSLAPRTSTWRIFLRGNRNQKLRILGIRAIDIKKEKHLSGTLFHIPPQGGEPNELMGINLDEVNPLVRAAKMVGDNMELGAPYFQEETIPLGDKDEQIIILRAITKRNTVSFSLQVDYQVGDTRESIKLDDNGKPFKLTAYSCKDGHLDYQRYYSLTGGGPQGTYGIYPESPDSPEARELKWFCD